MVPARKKDARQEIHFAKRLHSHGMRAYELVHTMYSVLYSVNLRKHCRAAMMHQVQDLAAADLAALRVAHRANSSARDFSSGRPRHRQRRVGSQARPPIGVCQDFFINAGKFLSGKSHFRQANFRQLSRSFHRPVKFAPTPKPLLLAACARLHTVRVG